MSDKDRIPTFSEERLSDEESAELADAPAKGVGDLAREVGPLLVYGAIVALLIVGAVFLFFFFKAASH